MTPSSADQLTVIFDGTSDFHTLLRRLLERRDRQHRIAWVVCQATEPAKHGRRLCEQDVVAITPEGDIDTGWRAFGRAVTAILGSPWPFRIATAPIICPLLSMTFSALAGLLRNLPVTRSWCERHPDGCRSQT